MEFYCFEIFEEDPCQCIADFHQYTSPYPDPERFRYTTCPYCGKAKARSSRPHRQCMVYSVYSDYVTMCT